MGNKALTNCKTLSGRLSVVVAATWVITGIAIIAPTSSHADDCEDVKIGDCLSATPGFAGAGGGGTFIMDAPSGNEQNHVYMGPSSAPDVEESMVIFPGRDAEVVERYTRNPGGTITHHLDFKEGGSSHPDDETLEIRAE